MAKSKASYICQACGAIHPRWMGRCDACGEWNSVVEEIASSAPIGGIARIKDKNVHFNGGIFSLDGKTSKLCSHKFLINQDPISMGQMIANKLLEKGGDKIISTIKNKM